MKTLVDRFKSQTPVFWQKVRHIAVALVTAATIVLSLGERFAIDESIVHIASYVIAIGTTLGITAQMTKE